jgi:rhamnose utilization protein RhaD (predicted bifunctional aldolase and dehydrogenase)
MKSHEKDFRGRETNVVWIKGSLTVGTGIQGMGFDGKSL